MESINRRDGAHRLKSDLGALPLWGSGFQLPAWTPTWLALVRAWPASPLAAGRHTAPRICRSPSQLCRLWADWPWATASLWSPTTPPLPRLPPAVPHPHSRQCRPDSAHTLVLPTVHLRAGCAGEPPSFLQSLPLPSPVWKPSDSGLRPASESRSQGFGSRQRLHHLPAVCPWPGSLACRSFNCKTDTCSVSGLGGPNKWSLTMKRKPCMCPQSLVIITFIVLVTINGDPPGKGRGWIWHC